MFFLFLLLIFIVPFTIEACPNGWIPSYNKSSSICYFLQNAKTDFIDAEGACIGFGGHLTSVHDMFENVFVTEKAKENFINSDDFWFGANSLTGNWSWMDNSPFDFSDWEKGQPQNLKSCGVIRMHDGKWLSDDCFKSKPYICKIVNMPSKVCPASWTFYKFTNFCYKVFDNSNWQDAENTCLADSGHLASIHGFEEAEFVADLAYWPGVDDDSDWTKEAWIGFYTNDSNQHWYWTDGTPFDYINWAANNPDNPGTENCGEIALESYGSNRKVGQFNNFPCSSVISKFVCKKAPQ